MIKNQTTLNLFQQSDPKSVTLFWPILNHLKTIPLTHSFPMYPFSTPWKHWNTGTLVETLGDSFIICLKQANNTWKFRKVLHKNFTGILFQSVAWEPDAGSLINLNPFDGFLAYRTCSCSKKVLMGVLAKPETVYLSNFRGSFVFKSMTVMPQFVIIARICNTCPNFSDILPQFVIAALFCNNSCTNL